MDRNAALCRYLIRLGDNALVLAQRLIELVTHSPELEEELASANFGLDYLGQARMFYSYAGELEGRERSEDDFAFHRDEREFCNFLLLEQPNGHFGDTISRSVLFEVFYVGLLEALEKCSDARLSEIAACAIREVRYHKRHNIHWLVRLGDGTEESHRRVQASVDKLWRFTGELFVGDETDNIVRDAFRGPDLDALQSSWQEEIAEVFRDATLRMPADQWMDHGGRKGEHTEHFGPLIAEMQYLQRSYPGLRW